MNRIAKSWLLVAAVLLSAGTARAVDLGDDPLGDDPLQELERLKRFDPVADLKQIPNLPEIDFVKKHLARFKQDTLESVAQAMRQVVQKLSDSETGKPTQDQQDGIVRSLDKLIEELDQECQACRQAGGSPTNRPTSPLTRSQITQGTGGIGQLRAEPTGGRKWNDLPPGERERILQSLTEGFPTRYQRILERYYRRLADGETPAAPAVDPAAEPASQP